ncbi:MAG: hypothetical protein ACI4JC_05765 [Faecalibacterium sp.]
MNKPYAIDFTTNTVTVTKKFLEAASMIGTTEFNTMMQLRQMNLTIVTKAPAKKKSKLTYDKMQKYISLLDEAEKYQSEFDVVLNESKAYDASYAYVLKWFRKTFPNYGKQPERDANLKIVNTPVNYDEEAA